MKRALLALLLLGVLAGAAAGGWYLHRERRITAFAGTAAFLRKAGVPAASIVEKETTTRRYTSGRWSSSATGGVSNRPVTRARA